MEKEYGPEKTRALAKYQGVVSLSMEEAKVVISTLWPDAENASPEEVYKALTLCTQYGLNPLMNHLFLVPFWNKKAQEYNYVCIRGITTNRLIASRTHSWSFLDDTPRISTEEEEIKHFRKLDPNKLRSIVKIKDLKSGAEMTAWGEWPLMKKDKNTGTLVPNNPKGFDQGSNSMENQACIRAERKGLDMLYPADLPNPSIPVTDEAGDIPFDAVGEATEVKEDDTPLPYQDEPEAGTKSGDSSAPEDEIFPEEQGGGGEETVSVTTKGEKPQKNRQVPAARDPASIRSLTDLFKACNQDFKNSEGKEMQPKDVVAELGHSSQYDITDTPAECYRKIKAPRS